MYSRCASLFAWILVRPFAVMSDSCSVKTAAHWQNHDAQVDNEPDLQTSMELRLDFRLGNMTVGEIISSINADKLERETNHGHDNWIIHYL